MTPDTYGAQVRGALGTLEEHTLATTSNLTPYRSTRPVDTFLQNNRPEVPTCTIESQMHGLAPAAMCQPHP